MSWFLGMLLLGGAAYGLWFLQTRRWAPLLRCLQRVRTLAGLPPISVAPRSVGKLIQQLESSLSAAEINIDSLRERLSHGDVSQQAVLRSMIEAVMITDPSNRLLLVNDAFKEMFRSSGPLIGLTVLETLRNTAIHEAARSALDGLNTQNLEVEIAEAPGRTFLLNANPILDEEGKIIGVVAVLRDYTQLKRLGESRKEFVENVSHELRTPLAIIQGYIETITENPALKKNEVESFLQIIKKHSDRLNALVNDLLTISRLESQRGREAQVHERERPACDVRSVLERSVRDFRIIASKKNISVELHCESDLSKGTIEADELEQALFNLLDNAVKYTPEGGRVSIEAADDEKDGLRICVSDTGLGIPESSLPHVFERFYRVDRGRSREMGGTGLGLSIVKHIILSRGGKVWVESRMGDGSKFYFTLPAANG